MERLLACVVWVLVAGTIFHPFRHDAPMPAVVHASTSHFSNDIPPPPAPVEDRSDRCTNLREMAQANRDAGYQQSADIWQRAYRKEC